MPRKYTDEQRDSKIQEIVDRNKGVDPDAAPEPYTPVTAEIPEAGTAPVKGGFSPSEGRVVDETGETVFEPEQATQPVPEPRTEPQVTPETTRTEPEVPSELEMPLYDVPLDAEFQITVGGQPRVVKGASLVNALGREQDIENRYAELKQRRADHDALVVAQARELMAKAGVFDPATGRFMAPQTPQPVPVEPQKPAVIEMPVFQASEDDVLEPHFYDSMNQFAKAVGSTLSDLAQRLQGVERFGRVSLEERERQANERWEQETREKLRATAPDVFATEDALNRGMQNMYGLYQRGLKAPVEEVATLVAASMRTQAPVTAPPPAAPTQRTTTPQARRPQKPPPVEAPTVGNRGRLPAATEPVTRQKIRLGTEASKDRVMEEIERRLGR
uniref:Uncharacterized protein n=1 Tax=viral metagenome TaxID=1070528 RepID=A0A6M3INM8_9ZZZZ